MTESQAIAAMGALAEPTRLRILRHLVAKGAEGASAGAIGKAVAASSSRLSFHLAALSAAGLLDATRVSRSIIYRVDLAAMGALIAYLMEDCCAQHPDVMSCCAPSRAHDGQN